MTAYATSTDMEARFDSRTLKDLVSDTGVPTQSLSLSTEMTAALDDATGAIKSALMVGGLYTDANLLALTGESLAYLKRLTCEIAMAYLILRRPDKYGKASREVRETIDQILEMFRSGARVFEVDENIAAGLPTVDGPRQDVYQRLNMIPDRTKNFYPHRQSRLPIGR